MKRRVFLAASTAASLGTSGAVSAASRAEAAEAAGKPHVFELRRYRLRSGALGARFAAYAKDALVPALVRAGIGPVGAWDVALGPDSPTVHLLLPHTDAASVVTLADRLMADDEYRKAAASSLALPPGDPPYESCASSLLAAFATMPDVETLGPEDAGPQRVFELRTYHSVTEAAGRRKIEMFESGEIDLFRRVGLHPVFFGRSLVGEGLPCLTYMVGWKDGVAREKAWTAFRDHPEWAKMRDDPRFADTVSRIDSTLLRPTDYSQI